MKLTDEQVALLDQEDQETCRFLEMVSDGPWKTGRLGIAYKCIAHEVDGSWNNDLLCGPNRDADATFIACARTDVPRLIQKLAHALRQVAAAKLMAEALEAELNVDESIQRSIGSGRFSISRGYQVKRRYQRLIWTKKQQALAAWNALETTQDGEDDAR